MLENEPIIRLSFFIGVFAVMALWEVLAPRRDLTQGKGTRWANNIALTAFNTLAVRFLAPLLPMGVAFWAQGEGFGLFPALQDLGLAYGLAVMLCVLILDGLIYGQHVLVHHLPILWRLHRMHHQDLDYDVTTGARFHPLEIFLSMAIKLAAVALLGAPPEAVLIFEVLLNGSAMFNHANVKLPAGLDRVLRLILVTPDMHRVHHSDIPRETHSNFGFCFPWWDRLFGTYRDQPEKGHEAMTIGLPIFRDPQELRLDRLLTQPFRKDQT